MVHAYQFQAELRLLRFWVSQSFDSLLLSTEKFPVFHDLTLSTMFLLRRSALLARDSARNVRPAQIAKLSLLTPRPAPVLMLPSVTRRWLTSDVKDTTASPIKQEVDEEILDPEALAAIEADMENMELKDDESDPDWFVDKGYEQDHPEYQQNDFMPLWQRRAAGDSSLSSAAEDMIKERKVNLPSVLALLEENKAENIGVIDMRSKCDWTDFMIVAESSRGERFLNSIADDVVSVVRLFYYGYSSRAVISIH
jgi:hypothetical protein